MGMLFDCVINNLLAIIQCLIKNDKIRMRWNIYW